MNVHTAWHPGGNSLGAVGDGAAADQSGYRALDRRPGFLPAEVFDDGRHPPATPTMPEKPTQSPTDLRKSFGKMKPVRFRYVR